MMKRGMMRTLSALVALVLLMTAMPITLAEENLPVLSSVEEVKEFILSGVDRLEKHMEFAYTANLDEFFSSPYGLEPFLEGTGMRGHRYSRSTAYRTAKVTATLYLSGARMVYAWRTGDSSMLTDDEKRALAKAEDIVAQAKKETSSELELETWIHDYIVRNVTYGVDEYRHEGAVGALITGMAVCEGYADVFYLLGTMAGLNVVYQYGDDEPEFDLVGHMWNLVELDGQWYHVDVTWNDPDDASNPNRVSYRYMNVGNDRMGDHYWQDFCHEPAETTDSRWCLE